MGTVFGTVLGDVLGDVLSSILGNVLGNGFAPPADSEWPLESRRLLHQLRRLLHQRLRLLTRFGSDGANNATTAPITSSIQCSLIGHHPLLRVREMSRGSLRSASYLRISHSQLPSGSGTLMVNVCKDCEAGGWINPPVIRRVSDLPNGLSAPPEKRNFSVRYGDAGLIDRGQAREYTAPENGPAAWPASHRDGLFHAGE